jgi:L-seryl-tRNA(Ser) seleniumtransferase
MSVYKHLGTRRIINCFDTYTLLGGHIMWDEVRIARDEADRSFAWIWDLEKKAGERIATLLGVEAAYVPVGVYAGMAQCIAALMVGTDKAKMMRLPSTRGMKNEVVIQKCLRDFQYDRSITVTGARIVEAGDEKKGCSLQDLEGAITSKTVAIHFMAHGPTGSYASRDCKWVPFEELLDIGAKHGVPVLVDAAFQCYPVGEFRKYVTAGADAALYSCKYFGGPNTAGLLLGKKSLIEAVALHSFIGQEGANLGNKFLSAAERGAYSSLFRGCKQDRASIVGAVVGLEKYLAVIEDVERNVLGPARQRANYFMKAFSGIPDVDLGIVDCTSPGVDPLKVAVKLTLRGKSSEQLRAIREKLMDGDPEIWVDANDDSLFINITSFRGLMMFDEEDKIVIAQNIAKALRDYQ